MKLWLPVLCQLVLLIVLSVKSESDGSSPEEICPCQPEESCSSPERHIFGRDVLDIQNFGLISPCRKFGDFPCCPKKPPPPKKIQLTAQDLQGFTQAELMELGVPPEQLRTIGSASLPLSQENPFIAQNQHNNAQLIDLTQPGAASLPPAGISALDGNRQAPQQQIQQRQQSTVMYRPAYQQPQQFFHQQRLQQPYPVYPAYRPMLPARPVYYSAPTLFRQG